MRILALVSAMCLLAGGVLIWQAYRLPVYTDADAPGRLSIELEKLPHEQRFKEWHRQLRNFETAHKRLYDWGQGVAALGVGLSLSAAWLAARKRFPRLRGKLPLMVAWLTAWAAQLPCLFWYCSLRQHRRDFPSWGDSIAIPIFQGTAMISLGMTATTLALLALTVNYAGVEKLSFRKPATGLEWLRLVLLGLWMTLTLPFIIFSVPDGDVTFIIPCALALTLLFTVAFGMEKNTAPRNPLTVSGRDFARWFKFTLIHPALSLLLYFAATGLPQSGTMGGVSFLLSMAGMMLNAPGLVVIHLLTLTVGPGQIPSADFFMLAAIPVTWALLAAGAWLVYRWCHRQRV